MIDSSFMTTLPDTWVLAVSIMLPAIAGKILEREFLEG